MDNNYEKTLKATIELMSEKGYHGTSIQMIADKVGITKSTIFHYFKNKEGILLAILEAYVPLAAKGFDQIADDNTINGKEKLYRFIQYHLRQVSEHRKVLNLNLREIRYFGEQNKKVYDHVQRAYVNMIEKIVLQIQKEDKKGFKGLDSKVVTNAIIGMCNWAVFWYKREGRMSVDKIAEQFYRMLINEDIQLSWTKKTKEQ